MEKLGDKKLTGKSSDRRERLAVFIAKFVVKRRFFVLLFMVSATVFWLYHAVQVPLKTFFPDLLPEHSYVDLIKKYESFGGTNQVLVELRVKDGTIFNQNTLDKVIRISEELTFFPGVDRNKIASIGVSKIKNFKISTWGIEFPSLMFPNPPANEKEMEDLKRNIYSNTLYYGKLVSLDSKAALITAEFFPEGADYNLVYDGLERIKAEYSDENNEIYIMGGPYLYGVVSHYIGQTGMVFLITGIVMLFLAAIYTRHIRLTVLPLLSAIVAAIWGVGFVGLLDYNLDPLILVVPLLISARALSHSIQHNWRINEEYAKCMDMKLACERTISALFYPGVSGIVTDAMGILLIAFVPIPIMQKLGLICFCWAMSMLFVVLVQDTIFYLYLPSLKNIHEWREKKRGGLMERVMSWVALSGRGKGRYAILTIVIVMVFVNGFFTLKLEVGDVYPGTPILRPTSPYNESCSVMARDFPGLMDPLLIIATADGERGIANQTLMRKVSEFQFYLMNNPLIKSTVSIADLIKNLTMKYQENDPRQFILPDTNAGVGTVLFLLMGGGAEPGDFDQYYISDHSAATLVAYCQDHTTRNIREIINYCENYISQIKETGIHFDLAAGAVGVVAATNDAVAKDQVLLSIAAFVITYIFCAFFFQSSVAAILLMLPLMAANLFVFGYMGFSGIGLNLQTLPVSTIAVGIGVDYGIYLLSRIKEESIRLGSLEEGISEGVRTAGNAVTITALIIIAGVAFWFISDIKFQSDMGFLLALVTFFHLLGTLFFLPVLVRVARPAFILKKVEGNTLLKKFVSDSRLGGRDTEGVLKTSFRFGLKEG